LPRVALGIEIHDVLGVGGGFVLVPAMIYILGMPTAAVVGTSLLQVIFVTGNVTFLQAVQTQTVDVVLAVVLLAGGVIGAQSGTQLGAKLRAEQLRIFLAIMVLAVSLKVLYDLTVPPLDVYSMVVHGACAGDRGRQEAARVLRPPQRPLNSGGVLFRNER